ncbi:MAG: AAA family ATPase [Candidatus Paceibacterota bacterium]|jgi:ATP-dependent Clp protease ATP-binding subunit ClpC
MTFKELKIIYGPYFYSLSLDKFFPKILRNILRKFCALAALISFFLSFDALPLYLGLADGLFFLFIFFYLALSFLEFFYRSMNGGSLDYALTNVLFSTGNIDVTSAFFKNKIGMEILLRTGIASDNLKHFIYSERPLTMASALVLTSDLVDLVQYASAVYDVDKSFQNFLSQNSVNRDEFIGAVNWVMNIENEKNRRDRFWSRENLGAIPSIGTNWAYGVSNDLGKFGLVFENSIDISALTIENGYRRKEVATLEGILLRREEANAIIIDDSEAVARDIVGRFLKRIKLGITQPALEHKNIIELDWNSLVSNYKNKNELESELLKILNQSVSAGNIILYVRDLAGFVSGFKNLGINLPSLIAPYLSSNNLPIIASATKTDFHFFIETVPALLEKFERIIPDSLGAEASIGVILEQVPSIEKQYGLFFSFPSILALANNADRFISYGEMPGKALDMLIEIAPWTVEQKIAILKEKDVATFVSEKTGITTGAVEEEEAVKIEHLEELLHQRVIGQNEAVSGIANAVRRSRSGINNPKKPLASFLFIGPTGVGKTEVSKALAESFFGNEKNMIRFDMSEYNGPEAVSQLIGDFTTNKSGLLASRVRDNPYSVLLLDEFEKAAPDVLDLFLQILDEGFFTDALGRQVVCRNLIIIATSNAGSSLIWETVKLKKDLTKEKDNIINKIIETKIFKPELINRFDGVILFHPLQNTELESIAQLELGKLAKRLKEQNVELVINADVVNFLVEKGNGSQFGGREVNRTIQNEIENIIAKKIVSGEAGPGSKIEIKKSELV